MKTGLRYIMLYYHKERKSVKQILSTFLSREDGAYSGQEIGKNGDAFRRFGARASEAGQEKQGTAAGGKGGGRIRRLVPDHVRFREIDGKFPCRLLQHAW